MVRTNKELIGKYVILTDIKCTDYYKDINGNMKTYDTLDEAHTECWFNELLDAIIVKIEMNYIDEPPPDWDIETGEIIKNN